MEEERVGFPKRVYFKFQHTHTHKKSGEKFSKLEWQDEISTIVSVRIFTFIILLFGLKVQTRKISKRF